MAVAAADQRWARHRAPSGWHWVGPRAGSTPDQPSRGPTYRTPESGGQEVDRIERRTGVGGPDGRPSFALSAADTRHLLRAHAQARVRGTVYDYLYNSATESTRTVAGQHAVLLGNGIGPGYDVPLLVLAAGQRTIAVSIAGTSATRWRAMTALTALALARTGR